MHLHLVPGLRVSGVVPLLPLHACMAWPGKTLPWLCVCHARILRHKPSWTRFLLPAQSFPLSFHHIHHSQLSYGTLHLPLRYRQFGNLWLEHEATLASLMKDQACPSTERWEHTNRPLTESKKMYKTKNKKAVSPGKYVWCLISSKSLNSKGEIHRNSEVVIIQLHDPVLHLISSNANSNYINIFTVKIEHNQFTE